MKARDAAFVICFLAVTDLAIKQWALSSLEPYGRPSPLLPFIALRLAFNEGISFSLLSFDGDFGRYALLLVTALLTLSVTVWTFRSSGTERLGLAFISGGAIPNLIDRVVDGRVTDYLDLHFGDWRPFIFNIADVWISIGAAILVIPLLLRPAARSD